MAATYTEITKQEIERFLRARYRAYDPNEYTRDHGEFVYDLSLSDVVAVRVYSSIQRHGMSTGSGEDAIRVVLVSKQLDRPINKKAGKSIVKRTQNWRNSLADRIEAFIEEYHEKETFYEAIAKGDQPPSRQVAPQPAQPQHPVPQPTQTVQQEKWTTDQYGNFVFSTEMKQKYILLIDQAIAKLGRFSPISYIDFLKSVQAFLSAKGRLSPKQKEAIDKALKRAGLFSQVSSKTNIRKLASDIIAQN